MRQPDDQEPDAEARQHDRGQRDRRNHQPAPDEQQAERYEQLVESLFVLMAGAAFEPEQPRPSKSKRTRP